MKPAATRERKYLLHNRPAGLDTPSRGSVITAAQYSGFWKLWWSQNYAKLGFQQVEGEPFMVRLASGPLPDL